MALRPEDIESKNFTIKLRGYDIDQVNDFMSQVEKDMSDVLKKYKAVGKKYTKDHKQLVYYKKRNHIVGQAIISARAEADQIVSNAKHEGRIIKQNAYNDAHKLTEKTEKRLDKDISDSVKHRNHIIKQSNNLADNSRKFRKRMALLLKSQLDFTNDKRWDKAFKAQDRVRKFNIPNISKRYDVKVSGHLPSRLSRKVVVYYPNGKVKEF